MTMVMTGTATSNYYKMTWLKVLPAFFSPNWSHEVSYLSLLGFGRS
jgi:hypothetical protein